MQKKGIWDLKHIQAKGKEDNQSDQSINQSTKQSINQSIRIYSWEKKNIRPNLGIKHK